MIKLKGTFDIHERGVNYDELLDSVCKLPDGNYKYYILNDKKNRALPQMKYLFGVVLKTISEKLDGNPPIDALYRYFEQLYAPKYSCKIQDLLFSYNNLKNERAFEVDNVINKVIDHAKLHWNIEVPTIEQMKQTTAAEAYVGAYDETWKFLNQ